MYVDHQEHQVAPTPAAARGGGLLRRLRRVLRRRSWLFVGSLALVVLALGLWGFTRYLTITGLPQESVLTRLYLTVQLFTLESGGVSGNVPWQLDVARVAAPLVAAYAAVRAVVMVLGTQVDRWRARRMRGHVVVVGLDERGLRLCRGLLERGDRVVGVTGPGPEPSSEPAWKRLREDGVLVLQGDGRQAETLRSASTQRAAHLVVLCANDDDTTQVVATARELVSPDRRAAPLQCVGVLSDPDLWRLLTAQELQRPDASGLHADFVDLDAVAALALVRRHPPLPGAPVLMTGDGGIAHDVLVAVARTRTTEVDDQQELVVVGAVRQLDEQPGPTDVARLPKVAVADVAEAVARLRAPCRAYICDEDERLAVVRALELRHRLPTGSEAVVVRQALAPVTRLLDVDAGPEGCEVRVFGFTDEACHVEVLLGGTKELLAQAIHRTYLADRGSTASGAAAGDPSLRPWSQLSETLRESNRDQARHIATHLRAIGMTVGPLFGEPQHLTEAEVEVMSRVEHERWVNERVRDGWRSGPRDSDARTTPYLVPWDDLTEDVRDLDRLFMRKLPDLLASVGLQVVRPSGLHSTR
jgi:hypothetical protein